VEQNQSQDSESSHIPWHPAFVEALQLELEAYKDCLEFFPEYQLTAEPLRIDCVVIKKAKDVVIKKNIAAIFREGNLLEYKSPDDYVSVADFYKVYGYACLYASFENIPITSLTISFVESHYPEKLLGHLKDVRGYTVEETGAGIYTVGGDILPIQVIDSRHLSEDENLWLKSLSNRLDLSAFMRISAGIAREGKAARITAYINAIVQANTRIIQEAIQMNSTLTIEKVLEDAGWIARWEARGEAKGEAIGEARGEARGKERMALDIARNMLNLGFPFETIVSVTQLDPEKVRALYQQQ